jgi:hypothetical protein
MAINHWIEQFGLDHALDYLIDEPFANVFLVDLKKQTYIVHRSSGGSLYTDGNGNYSTNPFEAIMQPVPAYTLEQFELDVENTVPRYGSLTSMAYDHWSDLDYTGIDWDVPYKRTGTGDK